MITLDTDKIYSVSDTRRLIEEALKKGTCYKSKDVSYYNIICAFDIETSNIKIVSDYGYKNIYIYNYLHGLTIRCIDIDLDNFKAPYGLKLSYTHGQPIDELYQEVLDIFPGFIRSGIISPDEQLRSILTLYLDNAPDNEEEHFSIMYCWQFAIEGKVIFGRSWDEFLVLYDVLTDYTSKNKQLLVWVHNLNMEFQYIRTLFNWVKVFSVDTRKPVYAITEDGIEFRCSYILTNYSLEKLGEQLHHYKISKLHTLDYSLHRSSETPMSTEEIQYCINDVLVVSAYIQECLLEERFLSKIPLTCTGYCRRFCRKHCLPKGHKNGRKYMKYHALMKSLQITSPEEYQQLKRCFQGGFTHCSSLWSGKKLTNMDSIDFTSSYPFVMLSEPIFPMSSSKLIDLKTREEFEYYMKYYFCIFDVELFDVTPKYINDNYISTSHCSGLIRKTKKTDANFIANNGRLVSCTHCVTTICSIDYEIIMKTYNIPKMKIHNFRIYKKGYLPKELLECIIELYKKKTTLKGVAGKEQEYQHAKGLLNSTFGMACMDINQDEVIYENDNWDRKPGNIEENLKIYNNSNKRFLFYPWAIAICAAARRNLWSGILEFGNDYVYADTDSIKCLNINKHLSYITKYNLICEKKLQRMCAFYGFDYEKDLCPKTIEGEVKPLGVWDYDGHYDEFKSLGAKRYIGRVGNDIKLTVSGVNKKVCVPYLIDTFGIDHVIDKFEIGLLIPEGKTGKLLHYYIDHDQSGTFTDYLGNDYTFRSEPPGIYLEDTSYNFDISQDYINYLKGVQHTI